MDPRVSTCAGDSHDLLERFSKVAELSIAGEARRIDNAQADLFPSETTPRSIQHAHSGSDEANCDPPSDSPLLRLCEAFAQGYERGGKPHSHHPWWPPTFHGRQRSRSRCLGARFPKLFVCEHLVREPVVHRLRPLCQWIGTSRSHWTKRQRWPSRSSAS